jgi:group I intron endonuclease
MIRAIEKHGWNNIEHEVLLEGISRVEAEQAEIKYISMHDSTDPAKGYNVFPGGNLRPPTSEETKAKIRAANLGTVRPVEVREKISRTTKGTGAYWYGKKHTEETKKKISESRKGRGSGAVFSQERKDKISKKQMGNQNAPQKATRCIETGIVYRSAREAARQTGLSSVRISMCCRGERQTTGGFHWEYIKVVV